MAGNKFSDLVKILCALFFAGASLFFFLQKTNAAGSQCQVIYGGGEVCPPAIKFSIDKQVQKNGKGSEFVDNLTVNDPKFGPNQTVIFKIIIKNTGDKKIEKLDVVDTLPEFLTFVSGPGIYDANKRTLSFSVENLEKDKTHEATFTAKTSEEKNLPVDQGVICVINQVKATDQGGATANDSTQLCIEKKVLAVTPQVFAAPPLKGLPPTGPEMFILPLLGGTGAIGFFLRKKSNKTIIK